MEALFRADYAGDRADEALVERAQQGKKAALEALIRRHQDWIYNIALRMVGNPEDAADVTQEVLIKLVTGLAKFERRSSFRTWVYRIVANHVLSMRRRPMERLFFSFDRHAALIESLQDGDAATGQSSLEEQELLFQETKTGCLTGMLLCLERRERIALILSTVFEASSELGGELLEMTPESYRQVLSRARARLGNFMNERCGLMSENNPCRCARKLPGAIRAGLVDPAKLRFNLPYLRSVRDFVAEKAPLVDAAVEARLQRVFRAQPMYRSPDFKRMVRSLLRRREVGEVVDFQGR
jgi:RNA polymerase sigma factor (sigma-70 family)